MSEIADVRKQIELALVDYSGEFTSATGGWAMGIADVVMPVVQAALEQAWDEGFDIGYNDRPNRDTTKPMPANPYAKGGKS